MNFVSYSLELYPAQPFSVLFLLFYYVLVSEILFVCVGWERGEPWGPLQLFCITAMLICSKKILWGRPGCWGACFALPEQNENLGEWQKILQSLVWISHLKHTVLFKFLLWTICCLLLELQQLIFPHYCFCIWNELYLTCFPKAVASVILFILLQTYEIFMKEECIRHCINFLLLQRFPDRLLLKILMFTLYKETLKYILSLFFPGDSFLVALHFPSSLYWFEIYSCEIKDW